MKIDGFEYPAVFIVFNQKKSFRMLFHERSYRSLKVPGLKGTTCWECVGKSLESMMMALQTTKFNTLLMDQKSGDHHRVDV